MGSSSKKRQTMAKMTRERTVKERRARKQEKKDAKKQAAAEARNAEATGGMLAEQPAEDEPAGYEAPVDGSAGERAVTQ